MPDIFIRMVLGHLVGDYLFQTYKMALAKGKSGFEGHLWCTIHCVVYTIAVCLFVQTVNPFIVGLVFLSHWPFDRWSLGGKWLRLIRGRDFIAAHYDKANEFREISISFSCLVYAVADNTIHLVLLWFVSFVV